MMCCTFHLNGGQLSTLSCPGVGFFAAYSGTKGPHRNNPDSMAIKDKGPIPPGRYYIVTRPRGGLKSHWNDMIRSLESGSDRDLWFALYRDDGSIDDYSFINDVKRGFFRLHPAGQSGISKGCITLPSHSDYAILLQALLIQPSILVSAQLKAFGTIQVY
ncbi:DUF2778 domain-containing protein [Scandinavium lactucae]|uniref:DUF2778 domain-containing protein n=1 Tax=Scandinavium lactucae TaxID=3095028 RepID=A0ABU4QWW2_9ENTR|nr:MULTISPECIES: DUF2778 domain-containing protein [unclassified Scandinavium]MDX6041745.1 DUF2778 domain-containing protein [Scandinavium sp. V105_6]MDX6051342.1 DUF2778 domain-containing protein [Scandinavium sp. V105_1]